MNKVYIRLTTENKNCNLTDNVSLKSETMSYQDFVKVIDALPTSISDIYLIGGDPLLVPSLKEYAHYATNKRFKAHLVTPCSIIPKGLDKLLKNLSSVSVQLKYPHADLHNEWNKNPKSYAHLLEVLSSCKKNKIPSQVRFEADAQNYIYLLRNISLCRKYGCSLYLVKFLPQNKEQAGLYLNDSLWDKLFKDAIKSRLSTKREKYDICEAGITEFCVLPNGDITISDKCSSVVGNILVEDFFTLKSRLTAERIRYIDCSSCPCVVERKKEMFPLDVIDKNLRW